MKKNVIFSIVMVGLVSIMATIPTNQKVAWQTILGTDYISNVVIPAPDGASIVAGKNNKAFVAKISSNGEIIKKTEISGATKVNQIIAIPDGYIVACVNDTVGVFVKLNSSLEVVLVQKYNGDLMTNNSYEFITRLSGGEYMVIGGNTLARLDPNGKIANNNLAETIVTGNFVIELNGSIYYGGDGIDEKGAYIAKCDVHLDKKMSNNFVDWARFSSVFIDKNNLVIGATKKGLQVGGIITLDTTGNIVSKIEFPFNGIVTFVTKYDNDNFVVTGYNDEDSYSGILKIVSKTGEVKATLVDEGVDKTLKSAYVADSSIVLAGYGNLNDPGEYKAGGFVAKLTTKSSGTTITILSHESVDCAFYPNPVINQANLRLANYANYNISVFDLSGKQVLTTSFSGNNYTFDRGNLSSGTYLLKVSGSGQSYSKKIVLK